MHGMQKRILRGCTHYTVEVQTPFRIDNADLGYLAVALICATDLPNGLHIGQRRTFTATWNTSCFYEHSIAGQRDFFHTVMCNFEEKLFKGLSEYDAITDCIMKKQSSWTHHLQDLAEMVEFRSFFNLELIDIVELHDLSDQEITDKSLETCQHVDDPNEAHLFPEPVPQVYRCTSRLEDLIPTYEEIRRTTSQGFSVWISSILASYLEDTEEEIPSPPVRAEVIEISPLEEMVPISQDEGSPTCEQIPWKRVTHRVYRITPVLLMRLGVFPCPCHGYHRMSWTHRSTCQACGWTA